MGRTMRTGRRQGKAMRDGPVALPYASDTAGGAGGMEGGSQPQEAGSTPAGQLG